MIPQGYPIYVEQAGRRYVVIGWSDAMTGPLVLPIDAPEGRPAMVGIPQELPEGDARWVLPDPARELVAEVLGVLDQYDEQYPEDPAQYRAADLIKTLRALLVSWS